MPIERIIGIDFGTSTSVVKVKTYKDNEPLGLKNAVEYVHFDNKDTLPTLVYKTEEDKFFIGYEAQDAAVKGTLYQNFKMNLISNYDMLRNEAITYTEIFFKYMYDAYDEQKPHFPACDIETTYVSYPAKWPEELRKLMISIASKAGFRNVKGLDEPTAAIHTVMVQESEKIILGGQDYADILMIDMGAGTTDLVLCRYSPYEEEHIEILNTWPKADSSCLFGGREVDEALCDYLKAYLIDCGLPNTKNFNEKYLDKCKVWKEANLSPILKKVNGVVKYCGFIDTLLAMMDIEKDFPPISRNDFENMLSGYISQFPKMITGCLESIGYDGGQLDYVILTGGHSQWYFTGEILEGTLTRFGTPKLPKIISDNKRIIKLSRPQETVALGLVYQKIIIKHHDRPSIKVTGVINLIVERYITKTGVDLFADNAALKRLEEAAKRAVAELAGEETAEIDIPYISANSNGPLHLKETITRSELTAFIARYQNHQSNNQNHQLNNQINQVNNQNYQATSQNYQVSNEKICVRCGKRIPASAEFCTYCGSRNTNTGGVVRQQEPPAEVGVFCTNCGKRIPASSAFCIYCGGRNISTAAIRQQEPPAQADIFCTNCGRKIRVNSAFCVYCGCAVQNPGPAVQPSITIKRESQVICVAVSYKIIVNGIDYGTIAPGKSKVVKSSDQIATVEIICTTIMMTNIKVKMRLKLGNNPIINFKLEYGGAIVPTVQGAEILERSN